MASARPILASFDLDSELCTLLKEKNCGIVTDPNNETEFIAGIEKLYYDKELRQQLGLNGFNYVKTSLTKDKCTSQYIETITSLL